MTTPTPEHPIMGDDLDQAYARAHALAGDERGPAASVRANVLAAAQAVAAQAKPPLVPVAAPVSNVAVGRPWAWNQLSWRVRSGATFCALVLVGLAAVRFGASRHDAADVMVAAADSPVASVRVVPASPPPALDMPPPPKALPMPAVVAQQHVVVPTAPADAAVAREKDDGPAAKAASRDPERVVAQADLPARFKEAPTIVASLAPPPAEQRVFAPAQPAPALAAAAPAPAIPEPGAVVAEADKPQRVEVTGARAGFSSPPDGNFLRGSAAAARKVSPALGSVSTSAPARVQPTPLHVAANADDVDTLARLLADPATRVDATDAEGRTPLQVAVMAANVRAVRLLLAAGADPDHADAAGATPRGIARTGPSAEIAALLAVRR